MNTTYTPEEIEHAKHVRAVANGHKGGKRAWQLLSDEQKAERIRRMVSGQKSKKQALQSHNNSDELPTPRQT